MRPKIAIFAFFSFFVRYSSDFSERKSERKISSEHLRALNTPKNALNYWIFSTIFEEI